MYRVNVVGSSLNVGTQSAVIPVTAFSPQHQVASSHSQSHNWQKLRENTWITDLINISLNKNFNSILIRPQQVGSLQYERNKSLKILMLRPDQTLVTRVVLISGFFPPQHVSVLSRLPPVGWKDCSSGALSWFISTAASSLADEALVDWTSDVRSDEILESQVWVGAGRRITNVGINWPSGAHWSDPEQDRTGRYWKGSPRIYFDLMD